MNFMIVTVVALFTMLFFLHSNIQSYQIVMQDLEILCLTSIFIVGEITSQLKQLIQTGPAGSIKFKVA